MRSVLVRGERGALRPYFRSARFVSYRGDAETVLHELGSASADCVVTSPPYFSVRHDLTVPGEIDHETTVDAYVARLARVGRELLRVVKRRGSLWLILGDTWGRREWLGVPWRVALALGGEGWGLRNEVIWCTPPAQRAAKDRLVPAHEHVFHFVRGPDAYFDMEAIRLSPGPARASGRGRVPTDVWVVPPDGSAFPDFAVFPEALAERPILATCPPEGTVLDPFLGSGTTAAVALRLGRSAVGIDTSTASLRFSTGRVRRLLRGAGTRRRPASTPRTR